jgi:hypothetical protein
MSEINNFNFLLCKMMCHMMWTSCMYIKFILVGTNYMVIGDYKASVQ